MKRLIVLGVLVFGVAVAAGGVFHSGGAEAAQCVPVTSNQPIVQNCGQPAGPDSNCGVTCEEGGYDYCGPAHNGAVRTIDGVRHQCFFANSGYGGYHSSRYGWVDGCGWLYTSCWNYQAWVGEHVLGSPDSNCGANCDPGGFPPEYCRQAITGHVAYIAPYLRICDYGLSYTYPNWGQFYPTTWGNVEGCHSPEPATGPCWRYRHEGYP